MRSFAKLITTGIVLAAALACAPVKCAADQTLRDDKVVLTDKIAGSTTVSYSTNGNTTVPLRWIFPITVNQPFTLECYAQETNAGTENITVVAAPTISGTNFDLTHKWTFSFPLVSAALPGTVLTNADLNLFGAAKYVGIVSVQNAHGSYVDVKIIKGQAQNAR